jgi:aquaporin Z
MSTVKPWQKYLAEVFGTFTLVFVGMTSVLAAYGAGGLPPSLLAPFGFGLALLAGLYAFGEVSGGHFNPAVSLAMFLDRRLPAGDLISYWMAQFVGAILAALIVLLAFDQDSVAATATRPSSDGTAFVFELVMTAIFVVVILQVTRSSTYGGSALVAIPLTLAAIHFAAIPFSGSSVNPARTFGPALVGSEWDSIWIYFLAPAAGAILGWVVHSVVVKGDTKLNPMAQMGGNP